MIATLEAIREDIDSRLAQAANDRRSAMHTPVVATADADTRVMVLRAFNPDTMTLRFHTDSRAPKAGVIGARAPVGVLFYDREAKLQIRTRGSGRIERAGALVDAAWAESTNFARRCYLGEGPGSVADGPSSGLPPQFEGVEPDDAQLLPARENFAILLVTIDELDWFTLAHTGHRRAQFVRTAGAWRGNWVTP
ncbi:pyridoxamine 5'-phosphate oxidase family protein [Erythrobacter sp. SDW2]|uniref:pyridoxamine 5'-phosphate oxidase family protein n=1 Tax=Erythrobacter sp. SDW2 TaxID=2907154 RepID=UPI001F3A0BCB|nr:pyridoxamine 5'-phosphate oxidase family protein [Erythrobacter sp. SDW2]UIP06255.1 pyridoxamine 5'-phosphate oxidase family protein [Erythrobacter sp. SDW2]